MVNSFRDQIALRQAIINPQTPEELMIALNDPNSPAYKLVINLLIEGASIEVIIERLYQKFDEAFIRENELEHQQYLIQQYDIIEKEKEKVQHDAYVKSKQAEVQAVIKAQINADNSPDLKKESVSLLAKINELQQINQQLGAELAQNQVQAVQNAQDRLELQRQHAEVVGEAIRNGRVPVYTPDGREMNQAELQRIAPVVTRTIVNDPTPEMRERVGQNRQQIPVTIRGQQDNLMRSLSLINALIRSMQPENDEDEESLLDDLHPRDEVTGTEKTQSIVADIFRMIRVNRQLINLVSNAKNANGEEFTAQYNVVEDKRIILKTEKEKLLAEKQVNSEHILDFNMQRKVIDDAISKQSSVENSSNNSNQKIIPT